MKTAHQGAGKTKNSGTRGVKENWTVEKQRDREREGEERSQQELEELTRDEVFLYKCLLP